MILTSSPYKQNLEASMKRKEEIDKVRKKRPFNIKNKSKKTPKKIAQKKKKISKDRESSGSSSEGDYSDYSVNDSTDESPDRSQNENAKCLYCNGLYCEDFHGEKWIRCTACRRWAHDECAGIEGMAAYVCELCNSD